MAKKTENIVFQGTGRRKESIARVRLVAGKGEITVNGKSLDEFFGTEILKVIVKQPLTVVGECEIERTGTTVTFKPDADIFDSEIFDYETWYNQDNAKLMEAIAKSRGETAEGVPYIIIGNKSWNGFTESYEQEIINEIKVVFNTN